MVSYGRLSQAKLQLSTEGSTKVTILSRRCGTFSDRL